LTLTLQADVVMISFLCRVFCIEVLGHRRRRSDPVKLPVSDSMFDYDSNTFSKEFRDRFGTLKAEFDEVCSLVSWIIIR